MGPLLSTVRSLQLGIRWSFFTLFKSIGIVKKLKAYLIDIIISAISTRYLIEKIFRLLAAFTGIVAVEVEWRQHAATANGESVSFKLSGLSSIVAMFTPSGSASCIYLPMTQWTPPQSCRHRRVYGTSKDHIIWYTSIKRSRTTLPELYGI